MRLKSALLSISILMLSLCSFELLAQNGYTYEHIKDSKHSLHIITIDLNILKPTLVKAGGNVFGRQTVHEMAIEHKAKVGINGGFFYIGQGKDGQPTGTVIVQNTVYALRQQENDYFVINPDATVEIKRLSIPLRVSIGAHQIPVQKLNRAIHQNETVLYNDKFGPSTNSVINRYETIIDSNHVVQKVIYGQNSSIPKGGYVLSTVTRPNFKLLDKVDIRVGFKGSALTGIPMLIRDGHISELVVNKKTQFYTNTHARTAIGLKPNNKMVLVVADNIYNPGIKDLTIDRLKAFFTQERSVDKKGIKRTSIGLTLHELAQLMKDLGCTDALNLDGGGSSSLVIEGRVKNISIGDKDEGEGQAILRPVSNAIIFR